MLKFYLRELTDLQIHQRNKFSSESLKGPTGIALPRGGDAYWFLVKNVISLCLNSIVELYNSIASCSHPTASVTKQYNLVPAKAGK